MRMRRLIEECNKQIEYRKFMTKTDDEDIHEKDYQNLRKLILSEVAFQNNDKSNEKMFCIVKKYYNKILSRCPLYKLQLQKRVDLNFPFKNFMKLGLARDNLGRAMRLKKIKTPFKDPSVLKGIFYVKCFLLKRFLISYMSRQHGPENHLKTQSMLIANKDEGELLKTLILNTRFVRRHSEVLIIETELGLTDFEFSESPCRAGRSYNENGVMKKSLFKELEFVCEIVHLDRSDFGILTLSDNIFSFASRSKDIDNDEYRLGPTRVMNTFVEFRKVWKLSEVTRIMVKYYNMIRQAVEISLFNHKTIVVVFFSESKLNGFLAEAKRVFHRTEIIENPKKKFQSKKIVEDWKKRKISNFEYLNQLNDFSSRSFELLSQYPVFPWIIKNFTEENFSITTDTIRDLRFPIAGISQKKRDEAQRKFEATDDFPGGRFQHGAHYLPELGVLGYLIRMQPYTLMQYKYNSGWDCPTRAFHSMTLMWGNLTEQSGSNYELIPEFYYNPEFLINM